MSDDVPNLRGGHSGTVSFILGPLLGACVVVGGIAYYSGRAPTREEFADAQRDTVELKLDVSAVKSKVGRLESIETKLDALLIDRLNTARKEGKGRER